MRNLRTAFGLLTTLPFGMPEDWLPGDSGRAGIWYPLVGVVIGGLVWLAWRVLNLCFPPLITGVLTLLVWVVITGGLHLDGLADCCDGLLGSATPERRLEIMKDPHLSAFGGIGLILTLLIKAVTLSLIPSSSGLRIILAATISRWRWWRGWRWRSLALPASRTGASTCGARSRWPAGWAAAQPSALPLCAPSLRRPANKLHLR